MALITSTHSIIAPATNPNFSAHSYHHIYAGIDATPVVNGVSVTMAAGSSLDVKINSISNGTGCYLLGENLNVLMGGPNL
jgi:hypothetical protein